MTPRRLDTFRTNSSYLSDMENAGNFISTDEHNKYVNDAIAELYDLEIDADNGKLFVTSAGTLAPTLGTITNAQGVVLPNDFNRLVSVHSLDGTKPYPAEPLDPSQWAEVVESPPSLHAPLYTLRKEFGTGVQELYVFPRLRVDRILVQYIPSAPVLSQDSDTFVGSNDELEYIEHRVAVRMLQKEESDTTALEYQLAKLTQRILNNVKDVDLSSPRTIRLNRKRGIHFTRGHRY